MSDSSDSDSECGPSDTRDHSSRSTKPLRNQFRRSMDLDLHNGSKYEITKITESTEPYDFDSDEDTFADAASDCEPNQLYLDEMLEDIHPERLNLFDYRKSSKSSRSLTRIKNGDMDGSNSCLDASLHDSKQFDFDDDGDNEIVVGKVISNRDDDMETETNPLDEEDTLDCLPKTINNGKGRRGSGLDTFGSPDITGQGRALLRQPSQKTVWGK